MSEEQTENTPASAKEYTVPDDLMAKWYAAKGAETLRDRYVKLRYFGYKPALRAAGAAARIEAEFWRDVRELYPELGINTRISLNTITRTVSKLP